MVAVGRPGSRYIGCGGFSKGAPMSSATASMANAQRRAILVARFEERLRELWPDEPGAGRIPFADFNDLEAKATVFGDATMRGLMESALKMALELPAAQRPERCSECGRKLQYSRKPKTTQTVRGPVRVERDYAYCRGCRRGFFPRREGLPSPEGTPERPAAEGAL